MASRSGLEEVKETAQTMLTSANRHKHLIGDGAKKRYFAKSKPITDVFAYYSPIRYNLHSNVGWADVLPMRILIRILR